MKQIFLEISQEHKLDLLIIGNRKTYRFSKGEEKLMIYQYYFDNNFSGAVEICRDKEATSDLLTAHAIPNIVHRTFISPLNTLSSDSKESSNFWEEIVNYANNFNFKVVCKPPLAANGRNIYFCNTKTDLDQYISKLIFCGEDICISPFFLSKFEYRIFMLNGSPQLIYKKVRPYIVGNSKDSVYELFLKSFYNLKNIPLDKVDLSILSNTYIPKEGEIIVLTRQHNLSHGADAHFDIEEDLKCKLHELATATAMALNIKFCSVDILEGDNGELKTIEVNPGIRTEILIKQHGLVGYQAAKELYTKAILEYFKIKC